jgi:hypothetical protein
VEFIPAISVFSAFDRLWGIFFYEGNLTVNNEATRERRVYIWVAGHHDPTVICKRALLPNEAIL